LVSVGHLIDRIELLHSADEMISVDEIIPDPQHCSCAGSKYQSITIISVADPEDF
jgi:hypothetical protein